MQDITEAITKFRSGGVICFIHADAAPADFYNIIELLLFEAQQCNHTKSASDQLAPPQQG